MVLTLKQKLGIILILLLVLVSVSSFTLYQLPNRNSSSSNYYVRVDIIDHPEITVLDNSSTLYEINIVLQAVPSTTNDDWDQEWQVDKITFSIDLDRFIDGTQLLDFSNSELELFNNPVDHANVDTDVELQENSVQWMITFEKTDLAHYSQKLSPTIEFLIPKDNCSTECKPNLISYTTTASFVDYKLLNEYTSITVADTVDF